MKSALVAFGAGVLFAVGLVVSGMTDPAKVIGFLDIAGAWDPSLALVMVGAIAVHASVRAWAVRRPSIAARIPVQAPLRVDARLLGGAALFGIGWGMSGFCPGPAVVSMASGAPAVLLFVGMMFTGMWLHAATVRLRSASAAPDQGPSPTS